MSKFTRLLAVGFTAITLVGTIVASSESASAAWGGGYGATPTQNGGGYGGRTSRGYGGNNHGNGSYGNGSYGRDRQVGGYGMRRQVGWSDQGGYGSHPRYVERPRVRHDYPRYERGYAPVCRSHCYN